MAIFTVKPYNSNHDYKGNKNHMLLPYCWQTEYLIIIKQSHNTYLYKNLILFWFKEIKSIYDCWEKHSKLKKKLNDVEKYNHRKT